MVLVVSEKKIGLIHKIFTTKHSFQTLIIFYSLFSHLSCLGFKWDRKPLRTSHQISWLEINAFNSQPRIASWGKVKQLLCFNVDLRVLFWGRRQISWLIFLLFQSSEESPSSNRNVKINIYSESRSDSMKLWHFFQSSI